MKHATDTLPKPVNGVRHMPVTERDDCPPEIADLCRAVTAARRAHLAYYGTPKPAYAADPKGWVAWSRGLQDLWRRYGDACNAARWPVHEWAHAESAWVDGGRTEGSCFEGAVYTTWQDWTWTVDDVRFTYRWGRGLSVHLYGK